MLKDYIYINNTTTKGRGVFTNSFIEKDTLVNGKLYFKCIYKTFKINKTKRGFF